MNEREFEEVFRDYREALGECAKTPVSSRRRRPYAVAFAGVAAIASVVFLAWPQDAASKALSRIGQAVRDARTMEVVYEIQNPSGKWHELSRTFYRDGCWRHEPKYKREHTVRKGGKVLIESEWLDYAVLEPESDFYGFGAGTESDVSALDFARLLAGHGDPSDVVSVREKASAPSEYEVVLSSTEEPARYTVIRVDRKTNLPIDATIAIHNPTRTDRWRQTYRFNHALLPSLFEQASKKPIVDVLEERKRLDENWRSPLATVGATNIRDVCMTRNGVVWVAITSSEARHEIPAKLISDSDYFPMRRALVPSENLGGKSKIQVEGEDIWILMFVPLDPAQRLEGPAKLAFRSFSPRELKGGPEPEDLVLLGETVSLPVRKEHGRFPDYFKAVDLGHWVWNMEWSLGLGRAAEYESRSRWVEAAEAYEKAASVFNGRRGFTDGAFRKAGECYAKAGKAELAAKAKARAKELAKLSWPD